MSTGLGDRMKINYENVTRHNLPRRTNTIIRVDGRAFHTFTRGCDKPFDHKLMRAMMNAAIDLCQEIGGSKMAYVQSDEISILSTDYDSLDTDAWFAGNVQKMTSISAARASVSFNKFYNKGATEALFDARVFTIPEQEEVINYFIWRQKDWTRNSLSMLAQSLYPHQELQNKKRDELHEMCFAKGKNWNDLTGAEKNGVAVVKGDRGWITLEAPIFTQNRGFIRFLFPKTEETQSD